MRRNGTSVSFTLPSVPFGNVLDQIAITARSDARFEDVLQAIDRRMRLLQSLTRDLPDGYLQLQRRLASDHGQSLRWVSGPRQASVSEKKAQTIINGYQGHMRERFASVHAEVRWLNVQERLCRAARKEFSQLSQFLATVSSTAEAMQTGE